MIPRNADSTISSLRPPATLLCLLLAVALSAGCGGGKDREPTPPGDTAEELTTRGWSSFKNGNFTGALADFDAAIGKDSSHGPAYVGRGWCRLIQAASASDFNAALTAFDNAFILQQTGPEVRTGRAMAHLGVGGSNLDSTIAEAQATLAAAPSFAFTYRPSIDAKDLYLALACARSIRNEMASALAAAEQIADSQIAEGDPGSWQVDGIVYPSFEAAVLAYLQKLSNQHAG